MEFHFLIATEGVRASHSTFSVLGFRLPSGEQANVKIVWYNNIPTLDILITAYAEIEAPKGSFNDKTFISLINNLTAKVQSIEKIGSKYIATLIYSNTSIRFKKGETIFLLSNGMVLSNYIIIKDILQSKPSLAKPVVPTKTLIIVNKASPKQGTELLPDYPISFPEDIGSIEPPIPIIKPPSIIIEFFDCRLWTSRPLAKIGTDLLPYYYYELEQSLEERIVPVVSSKVDESYISIRTYIEKYLTKESTDLKLETVEKSFDLLVSNFITFKADNFTEGYYISLLSGAIGKVENYEVISNRNVSYVVYKDSRVFKKGEFIFKLDSNESIFITNTTQKKPIERVRNILRKIPEKVEYTFGRIYKDAIRFTDIIITERNKSWYVQAEPYERQKDSLSNKILLKTNEGVFSVFEDEALKESKTNISLFLLLSDLGVPLLVDTGEEYLLQDAYPF